MTKSNVIKGLQKTQWHGRIEHIQRGQITKFRNNITILDGSHNEDGAIVLKKYLNNNSINNCNLIIGMMNNRNPRKFVSTFKKHINRVYVISIPGIESAYSSKELTQELKNIGLNILGCESLENALETVDKNLPLLITGSLYLTGHALKYNETVIN